MSEQEFTISTMVQDLRGRIFAAIAEELKESSGKSYEGKLLVSQVFGSYWEPHELHWQVDLHCYLLGPSRHYFWTGETLAEAVANAHIDLDSWGVPRAKQEAKQDE